jgi:hypothetical protein
MKPTLLAVAIASFVLGSCGGSRKPPNQPEEEPIGTSSDPPPTSTGATPLDAPPVGDGEHDKKKDDCNGSESVNLEEVLMRNACEVPLPKTNPPDLKGKLEVKVTANPPKTNPGGHVELVVSFANKTKDPMTLTFQIDPSPRFETEAFDVKGTRVDYPKTPTPPLKAGMPARVPGEPKGAKLILGPGGTVRHKLGWDAVKTKWAPEKLAGTPPERGYPRAPAGPLGKGKYYVKVVTPLVGVFEGSEREVTAPRTEVVVEK